MGHYDGHSLPLWQYAKKYTLADNFFQSAFGGSFLNHFWIACACTPRYENAPDEVMIKLDANGAQIKDGQVIDDHAVNTLQLGTQVAGMTRTRASQVKTFNFTTNPMHILATTPLAQRVAQRI